MEAIIIQTTCLNMEEARKISTHLLKKRLISSANFFPIKSTSSWTGEIKEVDEILIFFKTRKGNWEKVRSEIKRIHSYKLPCILKMSVEADRDYGLWINKQTKL
jgi:periplasmic divalent cation tolerance protein